MEGSCDAFEPAVSVSFIANLLPHEKGIENQESALLLLAVTALLT